MESLSELSTTGFREALTSSALRRFRLIYAGLALGVTAFAAVIAVLYDQPVIALPGEAEYSSVDTLSAVHILFFCTSWIVGTISFGRQFSDERLRIEVDQDAPAQKCLAMILTASIIRFAILEGAVFLGLTTSLISVINGVAHQEPIYLLNMLSGGIFIAYVILTFPTPGRIEAIFEKHFHS